MLARIDGEKQVSQQEVENRLRKSAVNLSRKIALGNIQQK
jgi:hypothetical protein